jgi:hypothetical protein
MQRAEVQYWIAISTVIMHGVAVVDMAEIMSVALSAQTQYQKETGPVPTSSASAIRQGASIAYSVLKSMGMSMCIRIVISTIARSQPRSMEACSTIAMSITA